jgi:hypothetical protein
MTETTDEEYEAYEISSEDFDRMIGSRKIASNITEHVTRSNSEAYHFLRDAAMDGDRATVYLRDGVSTLAVPIFINEGHSPGASASWIVDEVIRSISTMSEDIATYAQQGILDPDGWIIEVHHKE